jgi:hypothetical protein
MKWLESWQEVENLLSIYNVQLDLKALWDGRLARPDWAGKMPTPQEIKGSDGKVAHRIEYL